MATPGDSNPTDRPSDRELFECFRGRGDVRALGEVFDRHAPALLRVALHLTKDPGAAEDLVQATFLRAIEARDEWDAARPLLPWLVGVLHNRARHARWRDERRPDPERVRRPGDSDPVNAALAAEFDAAVDAAITELPELYRPVLRLHLAYGHAPAEIAHALDRPAATVRSQLARGLEQLRSRLPTGLAGAFAVGLASGEGLAAVKQNVLLSANEVLAGTSAAAAVSTAASSTAVGTAVSAVVGTGVAMKKGVLVLVLGLVTAGIWLGYQEMGGAPELPAPGGGEDSAARAAAAVERPTDAGDAERTRELAGAANDPASSVVDAHGSVTIECRYGDDDSAAWGVRVELARHGAFDGMRVLADRTGDEGRVRFSDLVPGSYTARADRGGSVEFEVTAGSEVTGMLMIPPGVTVAGTVVDESGHAVPHAAVWLARNKHDYADGRFATTADAAGRFHLRAVESDRFVSAIAPGYRAAVVAPVVGDVGAVCEVELVLRSNGATLRGIVVDPAGLPVPGARVRLGYHEDRFRWSKFFHGDFRPPRDVVTDARGEFVVHGLERGDSLPIWARTPNYCCWFRDVQLKDASETYLRIGLQVGGRIEGRIDSDGKPVEGAFITLRSSGLGGSGTIDDFTGPSWGHDAARTDSSGRYELSHVTPGAVQLRASDETREVRGEVAVDDGATAEWNAELREIALFGRVVDESGTPIAGVDLRARTARGKGNSVSGATDADGRFRCLRVASRPYVVTFYAPGDELRTRPIAKLRGVMPGRELLVEVPRSRLPDAIVRGRLVDFDGRVPTDARVRITMAGIRFGPEVHVDPATGAFELGPLPATTFRLQPRVARRRADWGDEHVLRSGETLDVGLLQMPRPGRIVLTAFGVDGEPLDGVAAVLVDSDGWRETAWMAGKVEGGKLVIEDVAPGRYQVAVGGRGLPDVRVPVEVFAGADATAELRVPAAIDCTVVVLPTSLPVPVDLEFEWRRDGVLLQSYVNMWEGVAEVRWPQVLAPGNYEVTVTADSGERTVSHFIIGPNDPPGREHPIRLP